MSEKLTNNKIEAKQLTDKASTIFKVSIEEKLYNNYDFTVLKNKGNMEDFQNLLYKFIGKSWDDIEKLYKRKNNKDDKYNGKQIIHFGEKDKSFRLHGVRSGEYFVLLRIDPQHNYNK